MIKWRFPLNNDGPVTGLNHGGIEHFNDDRIKSLAREICQNSLDARVSDKPVIVEFASFSLQTSKFPGCKDFYQALTFCYEYWKKQQSDKTANFFNRASGLLTKPNIPFLRISDFNTTGLRGSKRDFNTDWLNLTKWVGSSDKSSEAGGSFGIGKNATFACSLLRTVFYSTLDIEGIQAYQGVAQLVSFPNEDGENTQGSGYYGEEKNTPVFEEICLDPNFKRDSAGTDIYIAGFDIGANWKQEIIASVIDGFFLALKNGLLVLKVDDTTIDSSNLGEIISELSNYGYQGYVDKYFLALTSDDRYHIVKDFDGMGDVELTLLAGKDFPKRIAMVRGTGMKIFDKGHFRTPMRFAGVMFVKGEELNRYLRELENPRHDSWSYGRKDSPDEAKKLLSSLFNWLNSTVKDMTSASGGTEMDVEGLNQFLPDIEDESAADQMPVEGLKAEANQKKDLNLEITEIREKRKDRRHIIGLSDDEEYLTSATGGEQTLGKEKGSGGNGDRNRTDTPSKSKDGNENVQKYVPIKLKNVRSFSRNPGKYVIIFSSDLSVEGYLNVKIAGEEESEPAAVISAKIESSGKQLNCTGSRIGPLLFNENSRIRILCNIDSPVMYALEVSAVACK